MTMLLSRRIVVCALPVAAGATVLPAYVQKAQARAAEIYTGILSNTAVGGHDPVAYVTQGRPVPGARDITLTWKGASWRFANAGNRETFRADPERYAPAYGGYCAWAVAQNYRAKGDPRHWKIVEGRLYLNYDAQVQATWEKDIPGFIRKADANWPGVLAR
jgi:hypothetical protein